MSQQGFGDEQSTGPRSYIQLQYITVLDLNAVQIGTAAYVESIFTCGNGRLGSSTSISLSHFYSLHGLQVQECALLPKSLIMTPLHFESLIRGPTDAVEAVVTVCRAPNQCPEDLTLLKALKQSQLSQP